MKAILNWQPIETLKPKKNMPHILLGRWCILGYGEEPLFSTATVYFEHHPATNGFVSTLVCPHCGPLWPDPIDISEYSMWAEIPAPEITQRDIDFENTQTAKQKEILEIEKQIEENENTNKRLRALLREQT